MAYVFFDESGDLGFDFSKFRTSKYFVLTFLFVEKKRPIEKIVRKIFRGMSKKGRQHHSGILHCYKETPALRRKLLTLLAQKNISLMTIYLNKRKIYTKLQDEKAVLYNYVTNILLDRVYTRHVKTEDATIEFIASKRETNKFLNENFRSYLTSKVAKNHKTKIQIEIKMPGEEKCLQVVDFACWAAFHKREYGDESYWNLVKEKCVEESHLFP